MLHCRFKFNMSRVVQRQIRELSRSGLDWVSFDVNPDEPGVYQALLWSLDGPYKAGIFKLRLSFPVDYPARPPCVTFLTPVFHPNVATSGHICLSILKNDWEPGYCIQTILECIRVLMTDPNADDPYNSEAARMLKEDYNAYYAKAKAMTQEHTL